MEGKPGLSLEDHAVVTPAWRRKDVDLLSEEIPQKY